MEKYDYLSAVENDVREYIECNVDFRDYSDLDEMKEDLNEKLFVDDSVTGNASGSYGKYAENVGDFRLTSLICDILDYHHPHKDSIYRDEVKRILKYIDTKDKKYLDGAFTSYYKNKLIEYIA